MKFALSLLPLLAVHWGAMMSPGPNVLLVTQTAISKSRTQALAVGWGIATGGFIWCLSTLTGLAFLLAQFAWLRILLHGLGGAYLCYLAYKLWKNAAIKPSLASAGSLRTSSWRKGYLLGLSTNLTNPKTAVYFASILPIFIPPDAPLWSLAVILMLISSSSLAWHSILAIGFSNAHIQRSYIAAKKWIDRVSGSVLGIFGIKLLLSYR